MRGMGRGWQWLVFFLYSFINRIKMDCPVIISLSGMITTIVVPWIIIGGLQILCRKTL